MAVPPRIQRLLDSRELEAVAPDPDRIVGLWDKALASRSDSRKGLSADNAVALAYQAGFQACTAVLEACGYRSKGSGPGHHHNTFYAASALGYERLANVHVTSESIRSARTKSMYSGTRLGDEEVQKVHDWLDDLLPAVYAALAEAAPEVHPKLGPL